MKFPTLKLEFKTSQNSDLDTTLIKNKIFQKLDKEKYIIVEHTETYIKFGRRPFEIVWNFEAPFILDGGYFQLGKLEEDTIVTLNYFIDTLPTLGVWVILSGYIIIQKDYTGLIFIGTFFTIISFIQYFITKSKGESLLNEVLIKNIE